MAATGVIPVPFKIRFVPKHFLAAIVVLGSMTSIQCTTAAAAENHHPIETRWGARGNPSKVTRTVTIIATETKYNVTQLTFRKGETIKFVFVNKGQQPHELMVADAAEQAEHRKEMAEMPEQNMPAGGHHHDEGNVVDAKPGETKELLWRFTKKGTFEFACNYVGHTEARMIGTINVR